MEKVCIVGAGAIGGYIGAKLAACTSRNVSALARGPTLNALRSHGWRLRTAEGVEIRGPVEASDSPAALGVQDLVVVAVKAPALKEVASQIGPLIGPGTVILPAMNGVPWWFGERTASRVPNGLRSVDQDGAISSALPFKQLVGCVVHASAASIEPGFVETHRGSKLIIGEPNGGMTPRVESIAALLAEAGFEAQVSDNISSDIWYKLWGNITLNPISALTGATLDRIISDGILKNFCIDAMREVSKIGSRIGCEISQSPEDRLLLTEKLGAAKTSMLQDVESGRLLEIDSLLSATLEIGHDLSEPVNNLQILFGLVRLFAQVRGLYPSTTI